jgi:kumamolisin
VADLCTAYSFPTGLAGGGVIGILELGGGYTQADLDLFSQINGLPQIVPTAVSVNGGQNSPGQPPPWGDADGEVLLDIQVAAAAYFFCTGQIPTIKVFFAPNDDSSFAAIMNAALDAGCDVLSISWGKDEAAWDPNVANQVEAAAQATTEGGCVVFAASGDNSSGDMAPGANVDMPSSCPHIIGCGGTTKSAFKEAVWGDGTPNGQGTGGGYSVLFPPQDWQLNAPPSPGQPGRMVPDVAADANPNTGYLIVVNGQEIQIGGTSAVAPLYSGLFAAFGQKLGFVTPTLWQHPEAFVDITEGSNGSFQAGPGPDPCTGLGVPIGTALAALFTGASPSRRRRGQLAGVT